MTALEVSRSAAFVPLAASPRSPVIGSPVGNSVASSKTVCTAASNEEDLPIGSQPSTGSADTTSGTDEHSPVEETSVSPGKENESLARRLATLQDTLRTGSKASAEELLNDLSTMPRDSEDRSVYLDELLEEGPDRSDLPVWSKIRLMTRFSQRARWMSLRRTLDASTPPPNPEDAATDTPEDERRRRRRALVSILRAVAESGDTVSRLEKKARSSEKTMSGTDMIKRRPSDLETPNYKVVSQKSTYEIRQYDPFSVCSVSMSKPRPMSSATTDASIADPQQSSARAFGALAGYLFGKNKQESAMKMTMPVFSSSQDTDKTMSFVLPSDYWQSVENAPEPLPESGVTLERKGSETRAVVLFGGYASKSKVAEREAALRSSLGNDRKWQIAGDEDVMVAQYNDPFTPPWKRLNEVSIAVEERS